MSSKKFFHRPELAQTVCDLLMSDNGASGLFLSAPRRTGKSTFIREDLVPLMRRDFDAEVLYVDLWEDRSADPGSVIVNAIRDRLKEFENNLVKGVRSVGLSKIKFGGMEIDLDQIGAGKGETLAKALRVLSKASGKMIVVVIDEAQQTQTTKEGAMAMFSLKAARDELNCSQSKGFRLLATGSNSDKLGMLVNDKTQAFYLAPTTKIPPLSRTFLQWLLDDMKGIKPSIDALEKAFDMSGNRPEPLSKVLLDIRMSNGLDANNIDARVIDTMAEVLASARTTFIAEVRQLTPLLGSVLRVMAKQGQDFTPYSAATQKMYEAVARSLSSDIPKFDTQNVQYALDALRGEYQFAWKSGRGAYAIEDTQHIQWLREEMDVQVGGL